MIHRIVGYYELQHRAAWKLKSTDINPELEGTARLVFILKQPKGFILSIYLSIKLDKWYGIYQQLWDQIFAII